MYKTQFDIISKCKIDKTV